MEVGISSLHGAVSVSGVENSLSFNHTTDGINCKEQ